MHLCFKPTDPEGKDHVRLPLEAMTVIVGPNGAGKSEVLREIADKNAHYTYYQGYCNGNSRKILKCIHLNKPRIGIHEKVYKRLTETVAEQLKNLLSPPHTENETEHLIRTANLSRSLNRQSPRWAQLETEPGDDFPKALKRQVELLVKDGQITDLREFARQLIDEGAIYKHHIVPCNVHLSRLGQRMTSLGQHKLTSLHEPPKSAPMKLLTRPDLLASVNRHISECCGFEILVDASSLSNLQVLTTTEAPPFTPTSIPLDSASLCFLAQARQLQYESDGIQLFVATLVEAHISEADILLFDEPETSLHPPLARQLGQILTNLAEERGISIIAATHSPDFLAGCLSTRHPVSICRLEYRNGKGSARPLSPAALETMLDDPLLRSTGMMSALFHRAAIVCEGPSDRVLYSEINDRLAHHEPDHPRLMRDCLFIDVNGKPALPKVLANLHAMGIPLACVVDLDILLDKNLLERILEACDVHPVSVKSLGQMRDNVRTIFTDCTELIKKGGLSKLPPGEREAVKMFIESIARHGIFVPENGDLEQWLPDLNVPRGVRRKSDFVPAIFEKMGPLSTGLRPASGDIWAFLRQIARYLDSYVSPPNPPSPS